VSAAKRPWFAPRYGGSRGGLRRLAPELSRSETILEPPRDGMGQVVRACPAERASSVDRTVTQLVGSSLRCWRWTILRGVRYRHQSRATDERSRPRPIAPNERLLAHAWAKQRPRVALVLGSWLPPLHQSACSSSTSERSTPSSSLGGCGRLMFTPKSCPIPSRQLRSEPARRRP